MILYVTYKLQIQAGYFPSTQLKNLTALTKRRRPYVTSCQEIYINYCISSPRTRDSLGCNTWWSCTMKYYDEGETWSKRCILQSKSFVAVRYDVKRKLATEANWYFISLLLVKISEACSVASYDFFKKHLLYLKLVHCKNLWRHPGTSTRISSCFFIIFTV